MPRWIVLLIDLLIATIALLAAYQLRFNFEVPTLEWVLLGQALPVYALIRVLSFWIAGIHRSMVRHTGTDDARRIFLTVLAGSAVLALFNPLRFHMLDRTYLLPFSILIIDAMGTMIGMISARILVKLLYLRAKGSGKQRLRVLIYGAGEAGLITKRTLERDGSARVAVEAFVDDDPAKSGKRLEGAPIIHSDKLEER
ncbi:MAG: hypothetical protein KDB88_00760, partial [Flavobacteriales bacterium]|nr:hypothetical protein [Flavobacteriales bacterium]